MKKVFYLFTFILFLFSSYGSLLGADTESEIQTLISSLDSCKGCVFIRNGSEHKVPEAKAHLLRKYEAAKSQIKTAEDFVLGVASKSSITGTPYKIKFADGKEIDSEKFLLEKLKQIRNAASKESGKK